MIIFTLIYESFCYLLDSVYYLRDTFHAHIRNSKRSYMKVFALIYESCTKQVRKFPYLCTTFIFPN